MSTTMNDNIVKKLMNVANEWASQFDEKPPLDLRFCITSGNVLTVNGIVLGAASDFRADAAEFDEECLYIPTHGGSEYEIYINWTADNRCQIGHIKRTDVIYAAELVPVG